MNLSESKVSSIPMETPELQNIMERLSKQNSEYTEILSCIEEKMNRIHSIAQTQSHDGMDKRSAPSSFTSAMHEQLDFMSQYNNRLKQVLDHIQKIIG